MQTTNLISMILFLFKKLFFQNTQVDIVFQKIMPIDTWQNSQYVYFATPCGILRLHQQVRTHILLKTSFQFIFGFTPLPLGIKDTQFYRVLLNNIVNSTANSCFSGYKVFLLNISMIFLPILLKFVKFVYSDKRLI